MDEQTPETDTSRNSPAIEVVKLSGSKLKIGSEPQYESVLKFRDEETYNNTMAQLENMIPSQQVEWAKAYPDFTSASDIYNDAMEEAADLEFTESEYKAFKTKYQNYLYFPEYQDDFGAYIPYTNDTQASLLSINGYFMIGDSLIKKNPIKTYEELQVVQPGATYYRPIIKGNTIPPSPTPPSPTPSKQIVFAYLLDISGGIVDMKLKIGYEAYEWVRDWMDVGNGKRIRITFGRILRNADFNQKKIEWHSEVSFRKKGFLGKWYNYKSETSFKAGITYPDNSTQFMYHWENNVSSHDGYLGATYYKTPTDNYIIYNEKTREIANTTYENRLYRLPAYKAALEITFRGMPNALYYNISYGEIFAYTRSKDEIIK